MRNIVSILQILGCVAIGYVSNTTTNHSSAASLLLCDHFDASFNVSATHK